MNTVIIGNGIVALSIAFRLLQRAGASDRIIVVGPKARPGSATRHGMFGWCGCFLDYYAAKSKLLRYSSGLFAPKDSFILFSLYQCR